MEVLDKRILPGLNPSDRVEYPSAIWTGYQIMIYDLERKSCISFVGKAMYECAPGVFFFTVQAMHFCYQGHALMGTTLVFDRHQHTHTILNLHYINV